jgi:CubicO group peptidase (beta-lactamase class C family)
VLGVPIARASGQSFETFVRELQRDAAEPKRRLRSEPRRLRRARLGFGVSIVTRRDNVAHNIGTYGWDGGLGSSWRNDPKEQLTAILLTPRAWSAPTPPASTRDFWIAAYQSLDE